MPLIARDRAFLQDIVETNWMQHTLAAAALVAAAASERSPALRYIKRNLNHRPNLRFMLRERVTDVRTLHAQVQSLATLRLVREYAASLETVGSLLRAVRNRGHGGVLRLVNECNPRDVRAFFEVIRGERGRSVPRLLDWPDLRAIRRSGRSDLTARAENLFPWLTRLIPQLARQYVTGTVFRLVSLRRAPRGRDDGHRTYVFVHVLDAGDQRRTRNSSIIVQAYNKLKHGFNATANYGLYASFPRARTGIVALEIPKQWDAVNTVGQQLDLISVVGREVARFTLDFHKAGLI